MRRLLSAAIWVFGAFLTFILYLAMSFLTIAMYPFDRKRKMVHAQCYWWSDILINLNQHWKIDISGLENIDRRKAYVIVANHQSLADIILLYQIKTQFKWVAKENLFKVPVIGWCLSLAKHIKLERGKFASIKKVYREAASWLREDMSVLFFPEGTRSETDEINEFQNGAFKLAIKEKKPVLPILIKGTGDALPKHGRQIAAKIHCVLKVLPPIDTSAFMPDDFEALKNRVYSELKAASA